jgi:hypothetical protein
MGRLMAEQKPTYLVTQSLQHPFEPNSFALKMKATRSSETSDQIYHPVRNKKTIICHENLKLLIAYELEHCIEPESFNVKLW